MFFLLRMAFWLMVVFALLPTSKSQESTNVPQVAATDAVSAATAAMSDMAQFCTRQPAACDIGGQAATVVTHRAQAGARKVYDFITSETKPPETTPAKEQPVKDFSGRQDIRQTGAVKDKALKNAKKSPDHTGSIGSADDSDGSAVSHDTLTQEDLQMVWQEPAF
jgi:hypothetical protein